MIHQMRRWLAGLAVLVLMVGLIPAVTQAAPPWPDSINLPNGWLPEGVVTGRGPIIYSGSRRDGAIYAADLRTGQGAILVPGQAGRVAVGLSFDARSNYIFVAGGPTGTGSIYDATTGALVQEYALTTGGFVNDVIVTREAAYFTQSARAEYYRVPLGPAGEPGNASSATTIPLIGDWQQVAGFNANGIEATPNGKSLIIVNSTTGNLYRVEPATGVATLIDLGAATVTAGDGILLQGKTLYVVRNRLNQIAVVQLASDLSSGVITNVLTSPAFDIPTTVALFGNALYAVNARFSTPPTLDTPYNIVRLTR